MNISEYILSAGRCLAANKMRTLLTTLGIIVGISSVIFINTLGNSLGSTIENMLFSIYSGNEAYISLKKIKDNAEIEYDENGYPIYEEGIGFSQEIIDEYDKLYKGVANRIESKYVFGGVVETENKEISVGVEAITPALIEYNGEKISQGRSIIDKDIEACVAAIVIPYKLAKSYFGNGDPIGKTIVVKSQDKSKMYTFNVVGVLENNPLMGSSVAFHLYIPYSYGDVITGEEEDNLKYEYVTYSIKNIDDTELYKKETKAFFDDYLAGTGYEAEVELMTDNISSFNRILDIITTVIAAIAAISLFVGGIGVMNILLVSVTERTMEIGVRKAMGAENKSICIQFIIESIMISLLGSFLGIVFGLMESKVLAIVLVKYSVSQNFPVTVTLDIPYDSIIMAVVFSFIVGIVFGVYPAYKASKMEVVDALRYE